MGIRPRRKPSRRTAQGFLRASLTDGKPLPPLSPGDWQALLPLAHDHGLLAHLDGLPAMADAPTDIRRAVRDAARQAVAAQLRIEADLRTVHAALETAGASWAVVKGPVLSEHWYAHSGRRMFLDLDVVVDPADFPRALESLAAAGAVLIDRNFTHALEQKRAELSLLLPWGTALDLHWHVLNTAQLRSDIAVPVRQMLERRIWVSLGGLRIPTFDPADTLLHLCLHTILSGGQKLLWYRDLQQVLASARVDWSVVVDRSTSAGAGLLVAVALHRARRLAGAEVPRDVEKWVSPRGTAWRWSIRLLDRLRPPGGPTNRRLSGRLVVEASRQDTLSSLSALGRILRQELIAPVLHDRDHPWRHPRRRDDSPRANPLRQPPDDPADRDRYLRFVAEHADP